MDALQEQTPPNPWPLRIALAVGLAVAVGVVLYWQFRYYGEKRAVERFMEALSVGDYRLAYQIWKPTPAYSFQDFLQDWGETTSLGRVQSYEILAAESPPDSSGVIVTVRINGREPPERIWVEKDDKSLSFPP